MFKVMGSMRSTAGAVLGLASLASLHATQPAEAIEYAIPYLAGATLGLPTALPLPPGFYFTASGIAQLTDLKNGKGRSTGIDIDIYRFSFAGIFVSETKILGGTYSAFVREIVVDLTKTQNGITRNTFGVFNTIVSPFQLSWSLGGPVFFSVGQNFLLNNGTYDRNSQINLSNNFTTFETTAALTYLTPEFTASITAFYDVNTPNKKANSPFSLSGKYESGDVLTLDFSGQWQFGRLGLGIGGYYVVQVTDDRADGRVVPATPFNGRGGRAESLALGPNISYQAGPVSLAVYYTRDLFTRNYIGGDTIWTRAAVKF